ncbi:protein NDUFAF4 homolog [Centruroides sculpturatus]|uniref:protein NDUFAF4 homolog n=1 Tax=Centruroides sculpturatus TaxID=218467 RepID=UPI000C6E8263|nr:protein NDUFAF4 homolog [Centruroides sculpturatus]
MRITHEHIHVSSYNKVQNIPYLMKIGVWCAISRSRIIVPILFDKTVNTDQYFSIFDEFVKQLDDYELQEGYFQQDEESKKDDGKVLPQNRSYVKSSEYGVFEATSVPQGKISLRQVIEFLNKHQTDPNLWNAKLIAKEYKLDLTMTEQILKHFSLYSVAFPDKKYKPSRFLSLSNYQKYLPKKSSSNTVEAVKS